MPQNAKSYFSSEPNSVTHAQRIICTPSLLARESLLYVQEIGQLESLQPHKSSRSALHSFLFMHIKKGSGLLHYAGRDYPLSAGCLALIDCHEPYYHISSEHDPWQLNWVHFYGRDASMFYAHYLTLAQTPVLYGVAGSSFLQLHASLVQLHREPHAAAEWQSALLLHTLLTQLIVDCSAAPAAQDEKMESVRVYLDAHFAEEINLDTLAKEFFISKYYLCRRFKQCHHITIQQHIQNRRIAKAMELLRYSGLSIHEIARQVGFENGNYFNKVFLRAEGITAGAYRKRW